MLKLNAEDSKKMLEQLKRHEGRKLDAKGNHIAYRCTAGALTIGYGHNLDANPVPGITAGSRLTEEGAAELLVADVEKVEKALLQRFAWVLILEPARYAVLLNMAFNVGINGLAAFKNTLQHVLTADFSKAATGMLASKWAKQVKGRARELATQMESGQWQNGI